MTYRLYLIYEFVPPLNLYLKVENAQNLAQKHLGKTNGDKSAKVDMSTVTEPK